MCKSSQHTGQRHFDNAIMFWSMCETRQIGEYFASDANANSLYRDFGCNVLPVASGVVAKEVRISLYKLMQAHLLSISARVWGSWAPVSVGNVSECSLDRY
jgi:hypothetical protein